MVVCDSCWATQRRRDFLACATCITGVLIEAFGATPSAPMMTVAQTRDFYSRLSPDTKNGHSGE